MAEKFAEREATQKAQEAAKAVDTATRLGLGKIAPSITPETRAKREFERAGQVSNSLLSQSKKIQEMLERFSKHAQPESSSATQMNKQIITALESQSKLAKSIPGLSNLSEMYSLASEAIKGNDLRKGAAII